MESVAKRGPRLGELLQGVECRVVGGDLEAAINGVCSDSRQVVAGGLFVAVKGLRADGHDYVGQVMAAGVAAVVVGSGQARRWPDASCAIIETAEPARALGLLAAAFYDHPAREMVMVGITGTNGKTTTSYLIEAIIRENGGRPGVIGTVTYRYGGVEIPAPFTTPEPAALQKLLREMADSGVTHVVMEVSSHALAQQRLAGINFDLALFTNLSRDHLDFHGDMASYFAMKKKLFTDLLREEGMAVLCGDDEMQSRVNGNDELAPTAELIEAIGARGSRSCWVCGGRSGDIHADAFEFDLNGIRAMLATPAGPMTIRSSLVGGYNLSNIMLAVGAALALEIDGRVIEQALARFNTVPGRLERVTAAGGGGIEVFVDFAHTPDAMENVLATLRALKPGRLLVLFGCGGDRDRGKRPLMGGVAARLADVVVITSDNPRSEPPEQILAEIEQGVLQAGLERRPMAALMAGRERGYEIIVSRAQAIADTLLRARRGDVVVLSGKGHENYQIIKGVKHFFDDRVEAKKHLQARTCSCQEAPQP